MCASARARHQHTMKWYTIDRDRARVQENTYKISIVWAQCEHFERHMDVARCSAAGKSTRRRRLRKIRKKKVTDTSVVSSKRKEKIKKINTNERRGFIHKKGVTFGSIRLPDVHLTCARAVTLFFSSSLWSLLFFISTDNDLPDFGTLAHSNWIFVFSLHFSFR